MKASEVLKLLRVKRNTLSNYVKKGLIKVKCLPNNRYDYDEKSVYAFLNKDINRKTYVYCRVSTHTQKKDLENQELLLKTYCFNKGIKIDGIYKEIASGIDFSKRKEFFSLFDEISEGKVEKIIISSKDRLSRIGFSLLSEIFKKHQTEIEVLDSSTNIKTDSEEIFEEIITLLHCFAMKFYSNRRFRNKISEGIKECS